jgi:glycosyltransferase involved in cell wall biosynthesis
VLTTNQDHDGTELNVKADTWMPYGENAKVKYLSKSNRKYGSIKRSMDEVQPDVVYLNGMYSVPFVIYPLIAQKQRKNVKIVIAPRGMLQQGALKIKATKKSVYLFLLKYLISSSSDMTWHATDMQEYQDILLFREGSLVHTTGNIPEYSTNAQAFNTSKPLLHFASISLLTKKKNHLDFIKALGQTKSEQDIIYHIFGPVSDDEYYQLLLKEISKLPTNIHVEYKGVVHPSKIYEVLPNYKFFVLTTFGENFGHSIFEAFNLGIPVIISDQTPWKSLQEKQAGWDVDLNDPSGLQRAITEALNMDDDTYFKFRSGARKMAEQYMKENDFVSLYLKMFQ